MPLGVSEAGLPKGPFHASPWSLPLGPPTDPDSSRCCLVDFPGHQLGPLVVFAISETSPGHGLWRERGEDQKAAGSARR